MAHDTRTAFSVLCLIAGIAASSAGAAESPSGAAEKVAQSATATGSSGARVLEVLGPVFMGDVLRTDRAGEAQIRFVDNTRIVVGKDARVTIDKFVFNPGGAAEAVTLSAVRGAFRFITGNSRKSVYLIRTPVMTIGVRGTGLDGFVETGTGRTTIALYEGAAQLCDASDQCIDVNRSCQIVVAPPGGGFQDAPATARALFLPYSIAQGGLLPDYRLDVSACSGPTRLFRDSSESSGGRDTGERGGGSGGGGSRGGQSQN